MGAALGQGGHAGAIEMAHAGDAAVALTVSDPFCVEHHRREFLDLLAGDLDMVFANEEEIMSLFGSTDFDAAVAMRGRDRRARPS